MSHPSAILASHLASPAPDAETSACLEPTFLEAVTASLADETFVRLALGKYRGAGEERRCTVTRLLLKDVPHVRFVTRRGAQEMTENVRADAAAAKLAPLLGRDYLSATLFTTREDVTLAFNKKRVPRISRSRPTQTAAPTAEHDRAKDTIIDVAAPYLAHLGVTHRPTSAKGEGGHGEGSKGAQGNAIQAKPSMYAKFRQINRFVEILDQLIAASHVADMAAPVIVDIGSGKGYLTFALHDHLTRRLGKTPVTRGIEANAGLVAQCNGIVAACGLDGLSFVAAKAEAERPASLDVLIALHACDTATDDAIAIGIHAGADLIVCAPCCQHEVAPQLQPDSSSPTGAMAGILKYGLLRQRQADLITDAMRALLLEAHGYDVRIIEFVSTEHTAKNLLIAAVKSGKVDRQAAHSQLAELESVFGIRHQKLRNTLAPAEDGAVG